MPSEMQSDNKVIKSWADVLGEDDDYESYDEETIINQLLPTTSSSPPNIDEDIAPKYEDGK